MMTVTEKGTIESPKRNYITPYPVYEHLLSLFINIPLLWLPWLFVRFIHKKMCFDSSYAKPVYCSYNRFKYDFHQVKWHHESPFTNSLFGQDYPMEQMHAGIYAMQGKLYVLSTFGYIASRFLIHREIKKLRGIKNIKSLR